MRGSYSLARGGSCANGALMADDRFPDHMSSGFEAVDDHPKFALGCGRALIGCDVRQAHMPGRCASSVGTGALEGGANAVIAALAAVQYSGRNQKQFTFHNNLGIAHKIGKFRQNEYRFINEIFGLFSNDMGSNPGSSGTAGMMPLDCSAVPVRHSIYSSPSPFDRSRPPQCPGHRPFRSRSGFGAVLSH